MGEKSEYAKLMDSNILSIESTIGEHLSNGHTCQLLVARERTIMELLEYLDFEVNWNDPEGAIIGMGDGQIPLRLIRSVDVPYGMIFVR